MPIKFSISNNPKSPIDAFQEYFMEIKPYHAKILEVVQKYNFYDNIVTNIGEKFTYEFTMANTPLCSPVGFGLEFDGCDNCGYDAIECCNLGTCPPSLSTFENLSPTIVAPINSVSASTGDIFLTGNLTYDTTFAIKRIISGNTFSIAGDKSNYFSLFPTFSIIPYTTLNYNITGINSIAILGDYSTQFIHTPNFRIYGSKVNDGIYNVISANYNQSNNTTVIIFFQKMSVGDIGTLVFETITHNQGAFQVTTATYNGADTIVTINTSTSRNLVQENPTSVLFLTGFTQGRVIQLNENDPENNGKYLIVQSTYNPTDNITDVSITQLLPNDTDAIGTATLMLQMDLLDYITDLNCKNPKENNISVNFGEHLVIRGGFRPSPTPSPTPTITPTLTMAPTHTITPTTSITPSYSVTPFPTQQATPTVTGTVTPTVTATLTPSSTSDVTPTPTPPITHSVTPTPSSYPALGYNVIDADPRSSYYMHNYGQLSFLNIYTTAGQSSNFYHGAPFAVDTNTTNVINCTYNTNGVYTPTSRPPQIEDSSNPLPFMPLIVPTGGSGNFTVTISNITIQCQKQGYNQGPAGIGLVQATQSGQTTISTGCGNAIMCYNNGSAWVSGGAKTLMYNTYYNGFGPFFGMSACSSIPDYQALFPFTLTITDNVTGHTINVAGQIALDRAAIGSQGNYSPCS